MPCACGPEINPVRLLIYEQTADSPEKEDICMDKVSAAARNYYNSEYKSKGKSVEKLIQQAYMTGFISGIENHKSVISPKRSKNKPKAVVTKNRSSVKGEYICGDCGLHIKGWSRVIYDRDDRELLSYEYDFAFCPGCGAKILK